MTFDEFEREHRENFRHMIQYSPNEVGSGIYAERTSEMERAHLEGARQIEEMEKVLVIRCHSLVAQTPEQRFANTQASLP